MIIKEFLVCVSALISSVPFSQGESEYELYSRDDTFFHNGSSLASFPRIVKPGSERTEAPCLPPALCSLSVRTHTNFGHPFAARISKGPQFGNHGRERSKLPPAVISSGA